MKIYDKEIYQKQENLKNTFIIILVFLVGFFVGYLAHSFESSKDTIKNDSNTLLIQNDK